MVCRNLVRGSNPYIESKLCIRKWRVSSRSLNSSHDFVRIALSRFVYPKYSNEGETRFSLNRLPTRSSDFVLPPLLYPILEERPSKLLPARLPVFTQIHEIIRTFLDRELFDSTGYYYATTTVDILYTYLVEYYVHSMHIRIILVWSARSFGHCR